MTALIDAIRAHADHRPDRPALIGADGVTMDWQSLAQQVARDAADMAARLPAGRPVAMRFDQGLPHCLADLSLFEAGLAALPLPLFFSPAQSDHALAAAGAGSLLTGDGPVALPAVARADVPQGTAKISFTSGSTGAPKGICLSADHLLAVAQGVVDSVGAHHAGRHLALLPPGILLENVAGFYATIIAGGTYVALPQAAVGLGTPFRPDFGAMLRAVAGHGITSLILVPEYLSGLVTAMEMTGVRLPRLTLVAVGGARLDRALIDRALSLGLPVRQGYGLTECGSVVALEQAGESLRGSVGFSIGVNRIALAEDGEVLIEGPHALGVLGGAMPGGPLHTGDIGRIDAGGRLWIEGRKSNLIITSHGRNISPEWVEAALLAQPGVAQAMIHGEGQAELGALIVPGHETADIARAVHAANATLPTYAHVAHWQIVPPFTPLNGQLTGNGRLRRDAIAMAHLKGQDRMHFFDRIVADTATERAALLTVPQLRAGLAGQISRQTYIAYLTQAYHHVRHTVPLMQAARARLAHKPHLVAALDDYIEEETGHEQWILNDIRAAGGDADAAAASIPHPATQAMVDHAYARIRTGNPAAFFGMVYVLEGTSVAMASQGAEAVARSLGLPPQAFSYLSSHGALDQEHMGFFERLMNSIEDGDDQAAIIAMARDMFRLFGGMFAAIPLESVDEAA